MRQTFVPLALTAVLVMPLASQQKPFTDPANLGRERVEPRTGRELPIDGGDNDRALGLAQMLRRLNTRASILNIVAHPDDEDGGMLTVYARGFGARVADLSLTRGEGGQNAVTGDFEDALGLLRTQELLANDRYVGVSQMFGTEVDFGFSKTKAEAFRKWTHERCLYDAVRAIRIFRPLVITATFIGNPTDGHGQHQVSGEIAQDAFVAAGDPTVFPELTAEGILPWKPLRMYARVPTYAISKRGLYDYATNQYVPVEFTNYVTHTTYSTVPTADVIVHEGANDPLLTIAAAHRADLPESLANEPGSTPLSYVQFARIGLGLQRSQVDRNDRLAAPGPHDSSWHLYGSRLCGEHNEIPGLTSADCVKPVANAAATGGPDFFSGIDTSLNGLLNLEPNATISDAAWQSFTQSIAQAQDTFDPRHPEEAAPLIADAIKNLDLEVGWLEENTPPSPSRSSFEHELKVKQAQFNDALILALGLGNDATFSGTDEGAVHEGSSPTIHTSTEAPTHAGLSMEHSRIIADDATMLAAENVSIETGKLDGRISRPYFFRDNIEAPVYQLLRPDLRNAPASPVALTLWTDFTYNGVPLQVGRIVHDGPQPVRIVPRLNLQVTPRSQPLPTGTHTVTTRVQNIPANPQPLIFLTGSPLWKTTFDTSHAATGTRIFHIEIKDVGTHRFPLQAEAVLLGPGLSHRSERFDQSFRAVGYGDLPRTDYFQPARDTVTPMQLVLPQDVSIGYLPGTGDQVPEALTSVGLPVTMLTVADLTRASLARFTTVILGVRTYAAHSDLHGAPTAALLDFARGGGNVIVQYQTPEFTAADAPYPLSLGANEKVVDETAPVKLNEPEPDLLRSPNRITPADFNGWFEERGHGFMGTWDAHYTAPTETHDPGATAEHVAPQTPQRGGLLTTPLGRGRWTYVAFALYRQLPEAVPGAWRLMADLIAGR